MTAQKQRIAEILEEKQRRFFDASDRIWQYAETRFALTRSADELCALLEEEGFQVRRGASGMADAIVATWQNGGGKPAIGFLGEYDALYGMSQEALVPEKRPLEPGAAGHGCGHNGLGVGALAGAVGIKTYMQEAGLAGRLVYFGCPGEETGSGKAFLARDGEFQGLDAILTWHPFAENRVWGNSSLANYQPFFTFRGVSAHAAAAPEQGRSALDAAELMNIGVNYLREHIIPEARVHYAYLDAGGFSPNVVPAHAKLLYFIRAPKSSQTREIYERIVKIARGAALMTETEVEITWDTACVEYLPNPALTRAMYDNMTLLGKIPYTPDELALARSFTATLTQEERKNLRAVLSRAFPERTAEELDALAEQPMLEELYPFYLEPDAAMPGSTDVGDASWQAPTAQICAACYPQGVAIHSWQAVACGTSSLFHKGMLFAAKTIAMTALDLLERPELIARAAAELSARRGGARYDNPLPKDQMPG